MGNQLRLMNLIMAFAARFPTLKEQKLELQVHVRVELEPTRL
jgi:hypothetical protein